MNQLVVSASSGNPGTLCSAKLRAGHFFGEEGAGKLNIHRVELTRLEIFFPHLRHEFSATAPLADKQLPNVSFIDVSRKTVPLHDVCWEDESGEKELAPGVLQKMPFVRHEVQTLSGDHRVWDLHRKPLSRGRNSPIITRGTLADRFVLRGTKVNQLSRLLPTCYCKYFCNEFTKLKTCFSIEHRPKRGEITSAEGISPKMPQFNVIWS